ncbi:MAG: pilus assembly protein PilM [Oscillospiraceae bacterium]|nr:pilus assembly protein PilM [Oscillospiraceae bacterium]
MLSFEITDSQIKLVRGVQSGAKIRIQDAEISDLSEGYVQNGYVSEVPMVAAALSELLKSKNIKEREAIVSITSSSIVYKEMAVAKPKNMKNPAIIEAMIQANMNITNDYNISFTIAGEFEDEEKNKMLSVIAAACPQRLVDGYVRLFSHVGLQLKGAYVANNSATRLVLSTPKMDERMPLLAVQVDKHFLSMNLYENKQIAFSRFFNIDPADYDNVPDYVSRALYDNLYRMIQFIKTRAKDSKNNDTRPLQEIMLYGEWDSFSEINNAVAQFDNVRNTTFSMPSMVSTSTAFDFPKFVNAIGALCRINKDKEFINLLEATSAKSSTAGNTFLLSLAGTVVGSVALVAGAVLVLNMINSNYENQISSLQAQIDDPVMQNDLSIVDQRTTMLSGFQSYNDTVSRTAMLFNYQPKVQSYVFEKVRIPLENEEDPLLEEGEELDIESISINGYAVTVSFKGRSIDTDPTTIPSRYAKYLTEKVLNKYGEPYFMNVSYSGFTKLNDTDMDNYAYLQSGGEVQFDTLFSFSMSMSLQMGSDEPNATYGDNADEENSDNGENAENQEGVN